MDNNALQMMLYVVQAGAPYALTWCLITRLVSWLIGVVSGTKGDRLC